MKILLCTNTASQPRMMIFFFVNFVLWGIEWSRILPNGNLKYRHEKLKLCYIPNGIFSFFIILHQLFWNKKKSTFLQTDLSWRLTMRVDTLYLSHEKTWHSVIWASSTCSVSLRNKHCKGSVHKLVHLKYQMQETKFKTVKRPFGSRYRISGCIKFIPVY